MKKLVISLLVMMFVVPFSMKAQTAIDQLYEKYAGQKGFTSININPDMFKMLSNMDMSDSSEQAKESQNAMEKLSGLKMLVYEPEEGETNEAFMNEIRTLTKIKGYEEMMSVNENDETVKFLAKKDKNGTVTEMLMIVLESDEAVVMSMSGLLDMKTISEISKSLEIDGLENLDQMDKK
ncbi:MAG: hypothetical protein C0591_08665 [Marinilabiliales bacterium]|nr:MAG: hypothetical protein C0591_08665 [Marinilabiliales bacterium]